MLKYIFFLFFVLIFSCNEDKPYNEFEKKLIDQICECISLGKTTNNRDFLEKYEECSKKTSDLLENGLDQYADDARLSKEEYKKKIPEIIQDLTKNNKCW